MSPDDLATDGGLPADAEQPERSTDAPRPEDFRIPTIEELDAMRVAAGLSMKDLSDCAGFKSNRFSHILNNDVNPQTRTIRAFLTALRQFDGHSPSGEQGPEPEASELVDAESDGPTEVDVERIAARLRRLDADAVGEDPSPPDADENLLTDGGQCSDGTDRGAEVEMSGRSVFPYPGNKAKHAEWIVRQFPDHQCYVEPFGGAAGVLANKPESKVEVYNDRDGDLVQFFDVLRENGDELADWLDDLPLAREKYDEWAADWYDGWRPDDRVRRAGVFFFLRATAFAAKYRYQGGFKTSTSRNQALTYQNQIERLRAFADRFRGQVVVENDDCREILDRYDGADTLFYLDPPYADATFRYRRGKDFDHAALAKALDETEARWVVSYSAPPSCIREVAETLVTRTTKYLMAAGHNGPADEVNECLVLNYDPENVEPFVDGQAELDQFLSRPEAGNARSLSTENDRSDGGESR